MDTDIRSGEAFNLSLSEIEKTLRAHDFSPVIPPVSDRDRWQSLKSVPIVQRIIKEAETTGSEPVPSIRARDWLAITHTGERQEFDAKYRSRRHRLVRFLIAYAITRDSEYLEALQDYLWAICEETSWSFSAHIHNTVSTDLPPSHIPIIDMETPRTALVLAEVVYTLGEDIHPEIAERVRYEVSRRVTTPFYYRNDLYWMHWTCNWNAAGHAGALGAAIYLEADVKVLASIVHKGIRHVRNFLDGFDDDGGTSEGINCWNVGVGHYSILSQLLEARTAGKISLARDVPIFHEIARFPERIRLSGLQYVNFSDAPEEFKVSPFIVKYLNTLLDEDLTTAPVPLLKEHTYTLRDIASYEDEVADNVGNALQGDSDSPYTTPLSARSPQNTRPAPMHYLFRGLGWLISRADPNDEDSLILASKGGHNGENHNHNDGGHFIVHYRGESLLVDLGKDVFTKQMFSADRYSFLVCSSRGHSVPVVNGQYQGAGERYAAEVLNYGLEKSGDTVTYELSGLYPEESNLSSLKRTVGLARRNGGEVVVEDVWELTEPGQYAEVFWSFHKPEKLENSVRISGEKGCVELTWHVRVESSADPAPARAEPVIEHVPDALRTRGAYRIQFQWRDIRAGSFRLIVMPENCL